MLDGLFIGVDNVLANTPKLTEGETIEQKIERIVHNGEPIKDGAPIVFTERKDGVIPAYNPRTDRFEVAVEAMDKVTKSHLAKRQENLERLHGKNEPKTGETVAKGGENQQS